MLNSFCAMSRRNRPSINDFTKRSSPEFFCTSSQSNHDNSLFWQYALLLPSCDRLTSSPIRIIGAPTDNNKTVKRFLRCLFLMTWIISSEVGPSTPQFHDELSLVPSRLFSPFASLCFEL